MINKLQPKQQLAKGRNNSGGGRGKAEKTQVGVLGWVWEGGHTNRNQFIKKGLIK